MRSTSLLVVLLATALLIGGCVSQRSLQLEAWRSYSTVIEHIVELRESGSLSEEAYQRACDLANLAYEALCRWESGDLNARWVFGAILDQLQKIVLEDSE